MKGGIEMVNEEQKTAQEKANVSSEGTTWAEMMSQMCGICVEGEGCCADTWEKWMDQQGRDGFMKSMPWMMSCCIRTKAETDEKTAKENNKY
jgi:hypothetical protein